MTTPDLRVRHVLVPLDGSDFASAALPTGRAVAAGIGAELHTLEVPTESDHSVEAIARWVEQRGDCVVCLSAHGRGRILGALRGSVVDALLERLGDRILVVGPSADRPGWSPSPRWPTPLSHPRIVACVDGSVASEEILPVAAAWAYALDMEMTILTVADDLLPSIRLDAPAGRYGVDRDADGYVEELVDRWGDEAPEVTGRVVASPIGAADGVRTYLERNPTGLVAISTAARRGLRRVLRPATAAAIVRASSVPCLVAPVGVTEPGDLPLPRVRILDGSDA